MSDDVGAGQQGMGQHPQSGLTVDHLIYRHETAAAKERQHAGRPKAGQELEETFPQANGTQEREPQARDKAWDSTRKAA